MHYNMVHIAYYTELNLQFCNYAQKRRISRENSKGAPDNNFCGHFCPRRKAANFCHPGTYHFSLLPRFKQGSPAAPIIIGIHYPNHLRLLYCLMMPMMMGTMIMTCHDDVLNGSTFDNVMVKTHPIDTFHRQ